MDAWVFRVSRPPARAQGGWRPRPPPAWPAHPDANRDDSGRYHAPSTALITNTSQAASSLPRNQPHINSIVKLDSSPAHWFFLPERAAFHDIISSRPHPQAAHRAAAGSGSGSRGNIRLDALLTTRRRRDSLPPRPRPCQPPPAPPPMIARAAVDDSALLSDAPWSSSQHVSTGRCTTADAPTTTPHCHSQPNRDEEPSFLPTRLKTPSL